MKLIDMTCPHCGALLKVHSSGRAAVCDYCGAVLLIDDGTPIPQDADLFPDEPEENIREDSFESDEKKINRKSSRKRSQKHRENPIKNLKKRAETWLREKKTKVFDKKIRTEGEKDERARKIKKIIIISIVLAVATALLCINAMLMAYTFRLKKEAERKAESVAQQEITPEPTKEEVNYERYDETLEGRGKADHGRSRPSYVNVIGYAVVNSIQEYDIEQSDDFRNEDLWTVPTYTQDKQFWEETGSLPHKTEVVVCRQILKHTGYGHYSGYLLVERTDDRSQYYIKVSNFITKPYWTYQNDQRTAALTGDYVALFKQKSNYYPVDKDGDKVSVPDNTTVLVTGVTGLRRGVDEDENGIKALVWGKWRYGYGAIEVYFNSEDLKIIY